MFGRILQRFSKRASGDLQRNFHQEIGSALIKLSEGESPALLYAEIEKGVVSADVLWQCNGSKVQFRFASTDVKNLLYAHWVSLPQEERWATLSYIVRSGKFTIDLLYPDNLDPNEDLSDRRPRAIYEAFGAAEVDYSKPR